MPKAQKGVKIDWRWPTVALALGAILAVAIYVNLNIVDNSASKIRSGLVIDNSDTKVSWNRYKNVDIELKESLQISESGTYHLTGALEDGSILIDAGVGEVRLILDNVSINNLSGPAINCKNAENLTIELRGENQLSDGETYSQEYSEDVRGVIYSKGDLAIGGSGTLIINANYQDGIVGKDDVKFNSGYYVINAKSDAIVGKDSVYIVNGEYTLKSGNNSIKSTNVGDYGKGFILVEDADMDIDSSAQGLKATNSILIEKGEYNFETYDDAIHSENSFGIVDGTYRIVSGDDAIHADKEVIIDDGKINITKCYEGIEAQSVSINGGEILIYATDDGINAGNSGDDTASKDNSPTYNKTFKTDDNCILSFNDGYVYINSAGDGVDSNGYIYFNGGKVVIDGPTTNGNGALDAGLGLSMRKGEAIAVGSSGMAQGFGDNSGVPNVSVFFSSTQPANTRINIKDSSDQVIINHISAKSFSHLAAGSDKFVPGETYKIYLNGVEYRSFTIMETMTVIGQIGDNQFEMPESTNIPDTAEPNSIEVPETTEPVEPAESTNIPYVQPEQIDAY